MSSLARTPAHGNWLWLAGALGAVVALGGAAAGYSVAPGSPAAGRAAVAPAAAGPGAGARRPDATAGNQLGLRRGAWDASYLAGIPATAVFYDPGSALGSCWLGPFPAGGRYVSLPPQRFADGAACGSYLTVQGPRGQVQAEVVDLCPGCAADMINLSRAAFTQIADAGPGSARVRVWPDGNPPLPGPLVLRVRASPAGAPAVQVVGTGNPLTGLAVADPGIRGPAWRALRRDANGMWVGAGLAARPVLVRITDDRGHQVVLPPVRLGPGAVVRTGQWMYRPPAAAAARRHRAGRAPATVPARQPGHQLPGMLAALP